MPAIDVSCRYGAMGWRMEGGSPPTIFDMFSFSQAVNRAVTIACVSARVGSAMVMMIVEITVTRLSQDAPIPRAAPKKSSVGTQVIAYRQNGSVMAMMTVEMAATNVGITAQSNPKLHANRSNSFVTMVCCAVVTNGAICTK